MGGDRQGGVEIDDPTSWPENPHEPLDCLLWVDFDLSTIAGPSPMPMPSTEVPSHRATEPTSWPALVILVSPETLLTCILGHFC